MGDKREYYFSSKGKGDNLMVFYRTLKDKSRILTFEISNFWDDGCRVYMEFVDISNMEYPVCVKAVEMRQYSDLTHSIIDRTEEVEGHLRTEVFYKNLGHPFDVREFDKNE